MSEQKSNIETMQKIVDSAVVLFNKDGFSGASISHISNHAGVSKGNLYYYFKNKDELYLHCAKQCIADFRLYLTKNLNECDCNEEFALELLRLRMRFFEEYPNYRIFFLNILAKKPDHLADALCEIRREFKEENLNLFVKFLSHIPLGKGVTTEDIATFISVLQNYTSLAVETFDDTKNAAEQGKAILRMATIFINGLRVDMEE